ncbi:zinc-binding dehydrogenase [Nonomuraea sp. NPDC047529]|uniref:zinc-binding dehydrogenase n=1 Tax=Nonomuraea sp. NPDC047529 TaxID=3155623 RepID=UPI00340ED7D4
MRVGDAVKGVRPELRLGQRVFVRQHHQAYAHCDALSDCIYPVPDDVTDEAMLLARQAIIGIHAVRTAGIGLGTSVHVIGLGVIGQLIARLAVIAGARPVSAVDHHRNRLAAVQRVAQVAPLAEDVKNEVDVVLVACGSPSAVTEGLEMTAVGGALLLVGGRAGMTSIDLTGRVFRRNVRIIGVHQTGAVGPNGDSAKWQSLLDLAVRLIRDGSLNIEGLITHHVAPSEIASSYELLLGDKGNRIGAIIDWTID